MPTRTTLLLAIVAGAACSLLARSIQAQGSPSLFEQQTVWQRLAEQENRLEEIELRLLPPVDGAYHQPAFQTASATTNNNALERRVAELEKAMQQAEEAEKPTKPTQKWTGRIHTDYWTFPGNDAGSSFFERGDPTEAPQDRFLFRRLRLGLAGDVLEVGEYKIEFDFAKGIDVAIKDAYIGFNELPFLHTVLVGNQKRPYGLDHLNSSRYNVFMERPFTVEAYSPDARRLGICSYGVSDNEAWNWRWGGYVMRDIQNTGADLVPDDPGDHGYQIEAAGRLANTIWYDETSDGRGYAHWAISGALASPDGTAGGQSAARFNTRPEARTSKRWIDTGAIVGAENYQLLGLEGVVNVGPVQVVGEFQNSWVQRDISGPDVYFFGGYVYVAYFLTGEHEPWSRSSGTIGRVKPLENFFLVDKCRGGCGHGLGAWQVALRYSYGDYTDHDILGGIGESLTFGLNWWWTPYSRLQFNCVYGEITDRYDQNISSSTGLPSGAVGPTAGDYTIIGTRFAVDF